MTLNKTHARRSRARLVVTMVAAATIGLAGSVIVALPAAAADTDYYVDCAAPSNGTGTQASPWNVLSSVNAPTFGPGDRILFKSGTTCTGQIEPKGSGVAGNPIEMSSYGTGAKPILTAAGAAGAVITLRNVQQWEVSNLELRNPAAAADHRSGIVAINSSGGVLRHIQITNMTISQVSGYSGGWYSRNAGVGIQTDHTTPVSTFDDIVIAGNSFDRVDRIAIAVTPDRDGEGTGLTTGVKIQNNGIRYSGGDDILVVKGQGALIEGNDAAYGGTKSINACPPSGQYCNGASASIWMAGSLDTVVQGNSSVCNLNEADGQAFDVDWGNRNTLIQYNYSRNNRGGFILIMPPISVSGEPTSRVPSDGTVIRYNISEDDANTDPCPVQPRSNGPRDVIHFAGGVPNRTDSASPKPDIYNNTIFIPQNRGTYVIGSRSGVNTSGSFLFRNNLVVNYGTGGYVKTSGSTYANNLLYGNTHPTAPTASSITEDPQLTGPLPTGTTGVAGIEAFRPMASSPAARAGVTIANNGGRDLFGTTLPTAVPGIGAFEATSSNPIQNSGFDSGALGAWATSGSGTVSTVSSVLPARGTHAVQTGPANSGVQQTVSGLVPGATYRLTATMRVQTTGEQIALGVKSYGGNEAYAKTTSLVNTPIALSFTMGASSTAATVYCYKNSGTGAGYCDAFSLVRVTAPTNLVVNGGFETGVLTPWAASGSNASATSVSASGAMSGSYGLVTAASAGGAEQTIGGLAPSTTYVLTGWLRAAAGESIALGVKGAGATEAFRSVSGGTYSPVSIAFTTGSSSTSPTIYCYKNSGSSTGACDELTLTKLR